MHRRAGADVRAIILKRSGKNIVGHIVAPDFQSPRIAATQAAQHSGDVFPVRARVAVAFIQVGIVVVGIDVNASYGIPQIVLHAAVNQRRGPGYGQGQPRRASADVGAIVQSNIAINN